MRNKNIVAKIPTDKLRLFLKNNPVTVCRNGTYHAIVGRARQSSANVAALAGDLRVSYAKYVSSVYV